MGRAIGAVVVAEVLWTALWLGGSVGAQALFSIDATQPLTNVGLLVGFIAYSVLVSVLAGFVCAVVRKETPMRLCGLSPSSNSFLGSVLRRRHGP